MLSPGKWHLKVPKERGRNLAFRKFILQRARDNKRIQRALWNACASDILFWIDTFAWQYNPNKLFEEVGPFITWDFQVGPVLKILSNIVGRRDLLVEKSREMGASWLLLLVFLWLWIFHPRLKFLCMSRSEELVEADDEDSLFWKLDFVIDHLPDWMKPKTKRRKKYFGNLDNRSSMTGTATTGKAGVGGRATAILLDEFSQNKDDYEVLHRTSDTSKCRIFNGTHLGLDTAFYELSQRPDLDKLVMHWTQHPDKNKGLYRYDPEKNSVEVLDKSFNFGPDFRYVMDGSPTGGPFPGVRSPWYDAECKRKGSARAIAMDLDIDPKGSVSQFFDRLMIRILQEQYCRDPYWEGDLHYDKETGRPKALIPQKGGPLRLWCQLGPNGFPIPAIYALGADLSAGTGATPSVISGVRVATGEKILEYANPFMVPEAMAPLAVALCWIFKAPDGEGALFAWEGHGPGLVFGNKVVELGYRRIYYKTDDFEFHGEATDKPGWHPSTNAKRLLLEEYRASLHSRRYLNRSREALEECLAFRYDKRGNVEHSNTESTNDPSGATVNHSDRVIADALSDKMARSLGQPAAKKLEEPTPPMSMQWRRELRQRQEKESYAY